MNHYKKPKNLREEVYEYASVYIRHAGKEGRKKQVTRLINALVEIKQKYSIESIHQVGRRHVHWWDEQLVKQKRSSRTREAYWYGFKLLWKWLNRNGEPPRPKI